MDNTAYQDQLYEELFSDTKWHRMVDVVALLIVGLLMGATITYAVVLYRSNQTEVITPAGQSEILPSGIKIEQA